MMGIVKLTEKQTTSSVKDAASILITQQETVNGTTKESVRRATLPAIVDAIGKNGINENCRTIAQQVLEEATAETEEFLQYIGLNSDSEDDDSTAGIIINHNTVDSGTVTEMLRCAESYFDYAYTADGSVGNILYETGHGLYSDSLGDNAANGRYGIVCSSFVDAVINGVTFENSRYSGNAVNLGHHWGVVFDDTVPFGRTENPSDTEISNRYLTSQALARYAKKHGYLYRVDGKHQIRAGDILFSGLDGTRYLGIDHVAIVINASDTHVSVIEAWDGAVKSDGRSVGLRINKRALSYFTYGATFPMGSVFNPVKRLETVIGSSVSTSISQNTYSNLHSFSTSVEKGFYTIVCHGTFPSAPYVVTLYSGATDPVGHGSMHKIGNDCYLTFYAQKSGIASVVVANDGNTYTPSEISLYKGYAEITAFRSDYIGSELRSGDNLNNCVTSGAYYCGNTDVAQTILNTPLGSSAYSGFRMEVTKMSKKNRYMQTLWYLGRPEIMYVRHYYIPDGSETASWGNWYAYAGTEMV